MNENNLSLSKFKTKLKNENKIEWNHLKVAIIIMIITSDQNPNYENCRQYYGKFNRWRDKPWQIRVQIVWRWKGKYIILTSI